MKSKIFLQGVVATLLLSLVLVALPQFSPKVSADPGEMGWIKYEDNPVLPVASEGEWDQYGVGGACVINDGDTLKMWFTGYSEDGVTRIGYAESMQKYENNPVLSEEEGSDWESDGVGAPWVIKDGDTYKMWYTGIDENLNSRIGYAESGDGISWERRGMVIDLGASGTWDENGVGAPVL